MKVTRALADLEQVEAITCSHPAEALQHRPSGIRTPQTQKLAVNVQVDGELL
ncbi:hypothetical protein NVV30_00815 [Pseudomonas syringae]|nr:hypothetical protein [Pseudomonas syringae]